MRQKFIGFAISMFGILYLAPTDMYKDWVNYVALLAVGIGGVIYGDAK